MSLLTFHLGIILDILGFYSWCSKRGRLLPCVLVIKLNVFVQRPELATQAAFANTLVLHPTSGIEYITHVVICLVDHHMIILCQQPSPVPHIRHLLSGNNC